MSNKNTNIILCGANSYEKKYYFNEEFAILPQRIKDELQIACVTFTERCGGIMTLSFEEDGSLEITTEAEDADVMFDDINAGLEVRTLREEKQELFESLELFYKVFAGGGM